MYRTMWKQKQVFCLRLSTHSNDVILPEAQFVVVVSLKVQQSLVEFIP